MPLLEKVRIEVFFPDSPNRAYPNTQNAIEWEFTHSFGGCSVVPGIKGLYLSRAGKVVQDRVNVLSVDVSFRFAEQREAIEKYVDFLQQAIFGELSEEKVLITVHSVFHQYELPTAELP